ncbi:sulfite exporter TauE/SafE family protein [Candidatus Puniceispirillum sp.]|nr:sulfite exporter TauE/SafE family protein [Candidatus Puniceispirillum sp.]
MELIFLYIFCGLIAGMLIGIAGIGGVVLVPLLIYLAGADIHTSVAAAIFSFLISGTIGTIIYSRRGVIDWPVLRRLSLGAVPGTLSGSMILFYIEAELLRIFIAVMIVVSALREIILHKQIDSPRSSTISDNKYAIIGFVTGLLSALSGTGGPLILIPILSFLAVPTLTIIGLAQVIQVPVALFATFGNTWNNLVDWEMAGFISIGVAFGSFFGGQISKGIPVRGIRRFVALLLFASGVMMVFSIIF